MSKSKKRADKTLKGKPTRVRERARLQPKRTGTGKNPNGMPRSGIDQGLYPVRTDRGVILTNSQGRKVDLRTTQGKRWLEKLHGHVQDKGGYTNLSVAEFDLILSASALGVIVEQMSADYLTGIKFDPQIFAAISNRQCRILQALGLRRRSRDITPDPLDYAKSKTIEAEAVE